MAITTAMASSFKQESWKGKHVFTTTGFTVTGTSASSVNYTAVSAMTNIVPGMTFTGTNVGANSTVTAIVSATAFTSSVAATGSISGGTLTFTNPQATAIKLALYTSAATLSAATTAYSATNETSGTGYSAGGSALTFSASMPSLTTTVAWMDFSDLVFTTASITARGCLIYNSYGALNLAISTHDFGADQTSTAGDFTIVFPTADSSNAILRFA